MFVSPGTKLAHYKVLELIGKGGMGEVYRARDTKLGRDVAIKILPEAFAQDEERIRRFQREAKVLASLNHPNIAAIHGLEESEGTRYLTLELVPGETLADRIARGPISVNESIGIATKIAEGLEEAHEQGIVHRDLKPANIKLTPDDKVKILDFGLAIAFVEEAPPADDSMSPTITRDATRSGVIMGTAAYMSPEQAKGKRVGRRTDVFAFGSVLYEMLTGKKAFRGDGVSDVLAAVIKDEPDWGALPGDTPYWLRKVLRRCLAKAPAKRMQHIGDVRLELEEPMSELERVEPSKDRSKAMLSAATIAAIGVALWALVRGGAPGPKEVSSWQIPLPPGASLGDLLASTVGNPAPALAISPDGRSLAYVVNHEGRTQLYLKTVGALDGTAIEGAEDAAMPFFSADGRTLGFHSVSGTLMRVSLNGGAPVAIAEGDGGSVRGASWGVDGNIIFSMNTSGGLYRVPATGGEPELVVLPDRAGGVKALRFPNALPGGEVLLVTVMDVDIDSADDAKVVALWPETGEMRVLIEHGTSARYSPSGHLVYARAGGIYAAPFDANTVEVTGDPVRVLEGVAMYPTMGPAEFSLSRDGSLLYAPGRPVGTQYRLVWVDRTGAATPLVEEPRPFISPSISPDGRQLALSSNELNMSIWRYDIAQGTLTRIVSGSNSSNPLWTPDGTRITFTSDHEGSFDIFSIASDGSGQARKLVDVEGEIGIPLSWAPDGRALVFRQFDVTTGADLWLMTDDGTSAPILATVANEDSAAIAPDGRWMAYESDETGRLEIYLCTFPACESKRRVSDDGGTDPRWNPNGRELFYRSGYKMMAVDIGASDILTLKRAKMLFESDSYATFSFATFLGSYDVSADGERFIMIDQSASPPPPTELVLVQNWAEELNRLVPTDN